MKTKTMFAALLICLAAVLVPALASGDAGSAVQADLTQLGTDLTTAHNTLVSDATNVTTAANGGDKTAVKTALTTLRSDASTLLPAVHADRKQLVTDLQAARAAHLTGLGTDVRAALKTDRAVLKDLREALHQARQAVRALRQASVTTQP
jgi:hypothetical protein